MQAQKALEQLKADEKQAWTRLLRAEQAKVAEMRLECAGAESSLRDAQHALTCQQVRGLAMTPWPRCAGMRGQPSNPPGLRIASRMQLTGNENRGHGCFKAWSGLSHVRCSGLGRGARCCGEMVQMPHCVLQLIHALPLHAEAA